MNPSWRHNKAAARPLADVEVVKVLSSFRGRHAVRNRALFLLMVDTGLRVSSAISLYRQDLVQHGKLVDTVHVTKNNMKGKRRSHAVPLSKRARMALEAYLQETATTPAGRVFDVTRVTAWRVIDDAYRVAEIQHPYGTHACRKTFAQNIYERSGHDYMLTSRALGHESIATTQKYLSVNEDRLRKLVVGE